MDKLHTSMENVICQVCGKPHIFNCGVVLDKRAKGYMGNDIPTKYELCENCSKLFEKGYIALVEIDKDKSIGTFTESACKIGDAYRTSRVIHVKRETYNKIMRNHINPKYSLVFIDIELYNHISEICQPPLSANKDVNVNLLVH
jgi:hypothetical protein